MSSKSTKPPAGPLSLCPSDFQIPRRKIRTVAGMIAGSTSKRPLFDAEWWKGARIFIIFTRVSWFQLRQQSEWDESSPRHRAHINLNPACMDSVGLMQTNRRIIVWPKRGTMRRAKCEKMPEKEWSTKIARIKCTIGAEKWHTNRSFIETFKHISHFHSWATADVWKYMNNFYKQSEETSSSHISLSPSPSLCSPLELLLRWHT